MRQRVAILFGAQPPYNEFAFKCFILSVNKVQSYYEFYFPDVLDYVFTTDTVNYHRCHEVALDFAAHRELSADYFVVITDQPFNNNYFFHAGDSVSVITVNVWERRFSPPSLFEYLLHCIVASLVCARNQPLVQNDGAHTVTRFHTDTWGCLLDFTRQKRDDRVDIVLGYICDEHVEQIKYRYGLDYYEQMLKVISRNWIGSIENKGSVAYELKHYFNFNIDRDSGFNQTLWQRVSVTFFDIPGNIVQEAIKVVVTAVLAYLLLKLGFG